MSYKVFCDKNTAITINGEKISNTALFFRWQDAHTSDPDIETPQEIWTIKATIVDDKTTEVIIKTKVKE